MARSKKKDDGAGAPAWLVTFSDLMTLLLTFFVLLLSMASMDSTKLTRISSFDGKISSIAHSGAAKVSERIQLVVEIINNPETIMEKEKLLKELIFPDEILPPELSRSTLEENMRVLATPNGVVIVLTEALLFSPGSDKIPPVGQKLLSALVPLMYTSSADANITGHTDTGQDAMSIDEHQGANRLNTPVWTETGTKGNSILRRPAEPYSLSGNRAIAVLEYFVNIEKMEAKRFSVSGYGPDKPIASNDTAEGRAQNRRVEILLKTTQWLGQY